MKPIVARAAGGSRLESRLAGQAWDRRQLLQELGDRLPGRQAGDRLRLAHVVLKDVELDRATGRAADVVLLVRSDSKAGGEGESADDLVVAPDPGIDGGALNVASDGRRLRRREIGRRGRGAGEPEVVGHRVPVLDD